MTIRTAADWYATPTSQQEPVERLWHALEHQMVLYHMTARLYARSKGQEEHTSLRWETCVQPECKRRAALLDEILGLGEEATFGGQCWWPCTCGHRKCEPGNSHFFGDPQPGEPPTAFCMISGCTCKQFTPSTTYRPDLSEMAQLEIAQMEPSSSGSPNQRDGLTRKDARENKRGTR